MGDVRSTATVKEKQEDQGITCMFLGYAKNIIGGTYRMLNLHTKNIIISCDVIWQKTPMKSMYQEKKIPRQALISYKMKTSPITGLR